MHFLRECTYCNSSIKKLGSYLDLIENLRGCPVLYNYVVLCVHIRFLLIWARSGPYGPSPYMGPYGPGPIRARARALRYGENTFQKTHPGKSNLSYTIKCVDIGVFYTSSQKMCINIVSAPLYIFVFSTIFLG